MAVPGRTFEVTARLSVDGGRSQQGLAITLRLPQEWNSKRSERDIDGNEEITRFKVYVPPTARSDAGPTGTGTILRPKLSTQLTTRATRGFRFHRPR